jgi:hypothetical protein
MRGLITPVLHSAVLMGLSGCALFASGGGGPSSYRTDAGRATLYDISRRTDEWLNRNQYVIERRSSSPAQLTIQTQWKSRYPFDDEIKAGVVEAQTRLRINARATRRAAAGSADLRLVQVSAENMVRMADSLNWRHGYMTPMFKAYVDEVVYELRSLLQTGVRVF